MPFALWIGFALAALALVVRVLPVGSVHGKRLPRAPRVDDPRLGRSKGLPIAMRFRLDEDATGFPAGIGRAAHRALFSGQPGLTVHVVFACAAPDLLGRSAFADPRSAWFDVFFGYYEVEVDAAAWGRPFAYDRDAAGRLTLRLEELARLVRADWNYLSNGVYGVPAAAARAIDARGLDELVAKDLGRVRPAGCDRAFDQASLEDMVVVSPYSNDGGRDACSHGLVGWLWRRSFGTCRTPGLAPSFAPTSLRMRAYVCSEPGVGASGQPVHRTYVFGGAVNQAYDAVDPAENARFLGLQMASLEGILAEHRDLGFADETAGAPELAGGAVPANG